MHKRLFSIGLVICLVAPIAITAGIYAWRKYQIRKEIKQKLIKSIAKDELVLFKFTSQEIRTKVHWEHSREFEYQGEMYDVVESEQHGDTTLFWCWQDHAETQLNKTLHQLVANALQKQHNKGNDSERLTQFFKSLYFREAKPFAFSVEMPTTQTCAALRTGGALDGFDSSLEDPPDIH